MVRRLALHARLAHTVPSWVRPMRRLAQIARLANPVLWVRPMRRLAQIARLVNTVLLVGLAQIARLANTVTSWVRPVRRLAHIVLHQTPVWPAMGIHLQALLVQALV